MDEWKKLICRGNRCFELALLTQAAALYQAALVEAQRCLSEHERHDLGRPHGAAGDRAAVDADAAPGSDTQSSAERRYHEALATVAAYVVTRHNLADLSLRLDDTEEAAAHLLDAHERLSRIIDDGRLPWPLRCAAMHNSARTREAVLSFADQHGDPGATCAIERRITHMPTSSALH